MFSLQTIFGKGDKFYGLLEASADAARQSARALIALSRQKTPNPSLDEFRLARRREKQIFSDISAELVNTFVTALEREDIEALSGALYKIPKNIEKFAERYVLFADRLADVDFASRAADMHEAATHKLREKELRVASVGKLIERRLQEAQRSAMQRDQKMTDEMASRLAWARLHGTPSHFAHEGA